MEGSRATSEGKSMTHPPLSPWKYGEPMDAWLYPQVREKLAENGRLS